MTTKLPTRGESAGKASLSAIAHQQALDYLRLADKSKNPAIVKAAVELARERVRHQQAHENKISPKLVVTLATLVALITGCACWFVLVHYSGRIGIEITWVMICILLLLIALYTLLAGYLSQTNFMHIVRWTGEQLKHVVALPSFLSNRRKQQVVSLNANGDKDES